MKIKIEYFDEIPLINLSGRLDHKGSTILDEHLQSIDDKIKNIILDFQYVDYLSSIGIRTLIKWEKILKQKSGGLLFCSITPNVSQVLSIAGLIQLFTIAENKDKALSIIKEKNEPVEISTYNFNNRSFELTSYALNKSFFDLWNGSKDHNKLIPVNLYELGTAFGIGGFGISASDSEKVIGSFVSTGKTAGVIPADKDFHPDFLLSENPSDSIMYIKYGIGFSGKPAFRIKTKNNNITSLNDVLYSFKSYLTNNNLVIPDYFGIVAYGKGKVINGNYFRSIKEIEDNNPAGSISFENRIVYSTGIILNSYKEKVNDYNLKEYFTNKIALDENITATFSGIVFEDFDYTESDKPDEINNKISLEHLGSVISLNPDSVFDDITLWIYIPEKVRSGNEKRLIIEVRNSEPLVDEADIIARKIYSDSGKIIIDPLSGGYSANTYRVFSYDPNERELLPTVMKIGMRDWIEREIAAYHNYVKKFILNNSTTILGTAEHGSKAGLRYNFLGITGSGGKLSMLRDLYSNLSTDKLKSIFTNVFTNILKPWYGQPKWEIFFPFAGHNPMRIFKSICEDAETILGISAEQKTIYCEELQKELPNPYHFLKYYYEEKKDCSIHWYKSVIHGDLNLANIMLDDNNNIYIIDFSETRESNIVSDLGRIEPIIKIEMSRLNDENDLKEFLQFEYELAQIKTIDEIPRFSYNGKDDTLSKAYELISLFRKFAGKMTIFESNLVPYFLSVLEWTLPMISYRNFPVIRKKASFYSAAIMIERIIELEK